MITQLETPDLFLRPADPRFAEMLLCYYQRNQAFLEPFEPRQDAAFYTLAYQKALLVQDAAAAQQGSGFRFYLFPREDGQTIIGTIGLSNLVRGCFLSCFLGYKLDGGFVNRGYMTQAIRAVTQFAFDTLRLHRVEANVMPRNLPSLRALEKCGFQAEGLSRQYLKINGVWEDHIHMVLLNDAV